MTLAKILFLKRQLENMFNVRIHLDLYVYTQGEKSYWHSHSHPVQKCKCRECNTFAIVQIHVQMFQAMPIKR